MTKDNLEGMFPRWHLSGGQRMTVKMMMKKGEDVHVLNSLRLFEELHLTGGVLRIDGKVVAFTIESRYAKTLMSCILKSICRCTGAYTMINQQFVESMNA